MSTHHPAPLPHAPPVTRGIRNALLVTCLVGPLMGSLPGQRPGTGGQERDAGAWLAGPEESRHIPVARWGDLGLGAGGVREPRSHGSAGPLQRVQIRAGVARWTSPGGVVIQVREEGVRLDLPSGVDLLLAPDGFLHLRDPEADGVAPRPAGPYRGGLELLLGDGIVLRILLSGRSRPEVEQVGVRPSGAEEQQLLWHRGNPARRSLRVRSFRGARCVALGRGEAVYRLAALGPALFLEREQLAVEPMDDGRVPADASHGRGSAGQLPDDGLVLWAPALRGSLLALPQRFAGHNPEYPDLEDLCAGLARHAQQLLPTGRRLQRVQDTPLQLVAGRRCRLELDLPGTGGFRAPLAVRLLPPDKDHPLLEWQVEGDESALQMIRPLDPQQGRQSNNLRYFQRGLPVPLATPWPVEPRELPGDMELARRVLARLRGMR